MEYNIGLIDDDTSKITQLYTCLKMGTSSKNEKICKTQYDDIKLKPLEIELGIHIEDIIEKIRANRCDALIIDYKLSSQQAVSYNGVELVKAIEKRFSGFPMFILTSHESDLFTKELFDAYLVFDFERYISEELERIELNTKIIEQVKKYRLTIEQVKSELYSLIESKGNNVAIDDQILRLDSFIERSMFGGSCLNDKLKKDLSGNNLRDLIERIDILLKR